MNLSGLAHRERSPASSAAFTWSALASTPARSNAQALTKKATLAIKNRHDEICADYREKLKFVLEDLPGLAQDLEYAREWLSRYHSDDDFQARHSEKEYNDVLAAEGEMHHKLDGNISLAEYLVEQLRIHCGDGKNKELLERAAEVLRKARDGLTVAAVGAAFYMIIQEILPALVFLF